MGPPGPSSAIIIPLLHARHMRDLITCLIDLPHPRKIASIVSPNEETGKRRLVTCLRSWQNQDPNPSVWAEHRYLNPVLHALFPCQRSDPETEHLPRTKRRSSALTLCFQMRNRGPGRGRWGYRPRGRLCEGEWPQLFRLDWPFTSKQPCEFS